MPIKARSTLWGSLLLACQIHQNVSLAETAVERFVELEADDSGVYVLLSNIYADAGMWEDALKARRLMEDRELKKEAGSSIIEVDCDIHEFVNGEKSPVQVRTTFCHSELIKDAYVCYMYIGCLNVKILRIKFLAWTPGNRLFWELKRKSMIATKLLQLS
jgi:hypothetical protein